MEANEDTDVTQLLGQLMGPEVHWPWSSRTCGHLNAPAAGTKMWTMPPPAPPAGQSPVCTEWSKHLTWSLFIVTSANVYKQKHEEQQQQSTESNTLWEPPAHSPQVWQRPRKVGCSSEKNQLLNLKTISPRPQERGATAEEKTESCRETNQGPTADQASRDRYQGRTWFWFLTTSAATLLVELTQCLECFWPFFSGRNYLFVFI